MTRTIAFLAYDFRASGVVRNILRIAAAAREAGLDARRLDFARMLAGVPRINTLFWPLPSVYGDPLP